MAEWGAPYVCDSGGNTRRPNYTNYGIRHTVQSHGGLRHQAASCTTLLFFKYFIVHIPLLSSSMSVSVYSHMVGAFHVSSVCAAAPTTSVFVAFWDKEAEHSCIGKPG